MNIICLELVKGDKVKDKIYDFIQENNWKEALIIGAIGSLSEVTVANPLSTGSTGTVLAVAKAAPIEIKKTNYKMPLECLSFTGEIKHMDDIDDQLRRIYNRDDLDYFIHIHASFSHGDGQVIGGGLHEAVVMRALRVMLVRVE